MPSTARSGSNKSEGFVSPWHHLASPNAAWLTRAVRRFLTSRCGNHTQRLIDYDFTV